MVFPKNLNFYLKDLKFLMEEDFSLKEATPFNILLCSLINKKVEMSSEAKSYSRNMKFPEGSNSNSINDRKKESYLPLIKVDVNNGEQLNQELDIFTKHIYNLIGIDSEEIKNCIEIALSEIFNNVRSHSNAGKISYVAQKWFDEKLEISIYDNGVGFKESLNSNSEINALEDAVMKKKSNTGDKSRGWGIQLLKTLTLNKIVNGEFLVISNDSYCYINNKKGVYTEFDKLGYNIKGSMITLRFDNIKDNSNEIIEIMYRPNEFLFESGLLNQKEAFLN